MIGRFGARARAGGASAGPGRQEAGQRLAHGPAGHRLLGVGPLRSRSPLVLLSRGPLGDTCASYSHSPAYSDHLLLSSSPAPSPPATNSIALEAAPVGQAKH